MYRKAKRCTIAMATTTTTTSYRRNSNPSQQWHQKHHPHNTFTHSLIQPHVTSKDAIRLDSGEESLFKAEHCGRQLETL